MIEALPLRILEGGPAGIPPALIFFAGAAVILLLRGRSLEWLRQIVLLAVPFVGVYNLLCLDAGVSWVWNFMGFDFVQLRVDRLSFLFGLLFHLGALLGSIYALKIRDSQQHVAALVYAGGALGAVFAGDLITLFGYWEIMAVSSVFLIWARRSEDSAGAGMRYLATHLLSGILLLAGALYQYQISSQIVFSHIGLESAAGWLILLAFGVKCGFPLLHCWITDGYPNATPTGTVFLSMFTTKVAVYGLARGFAGTELLVTIGTVMALFPIFYAVIENDLRRVLGYSMINQIGFMVVGVGVGTELAMNGAVAHAFNEVLFKGLLFMTMGAVLVRVGHVLGSDLGGLYRRMPWTAAFCVVGAASISAFPLFNGFVSKSMIMAAMLEQGHSLAWLGLLFASAGVFHHAGIKIPFFAFFAHDARLKVAEAPGNMLIAMGLAAIGCIAVGSFPEMLYGMLPWDAGYVPYTYPHVIVQVQLLLFSALAFAWLKLTGIYPPELRSTNLDAEWLYRRLAPNAFKLIFAGFSRAQAAAAQGVKAWMGRARRLRVSPRTAMTLGSQTGTAAILVSSCLIVYLLLYYSNR